MFLSSRYYPSRNFLFASRYVSSRNNLEIDLYLEFRISSSSFFSVHLVGTVLK